MSQALRRVEQATAEAVELVGRVQRAGVTEELEGLPLELLLALQHRLVSSDARMLLEAARVLERMPCIKGLFAEGRLSWGQVRGIVARLRRLVRGGSGRGGRAGGGLAGTGGRTQPRRAGVDRGTCRRRDRWAAPARAPRAADGAGRFRGSPAFVRRFGAACTANWTRSPEPPVSTPWMPPVAPVRASEESRGRPRAGPANGARGWCASAPTGWAAARAARPGSC